MSMKVTKYRKPQLRTFSSSSNNRTCKSNRQWVPFLCCLSREQNRVEMHRSSRIRRRMRGFLIDLPHKIGPYLMDNSLHKRGSKTSKFKGKIRERKENQISSSSSLESSKENLVWCSHRLSNQISGFWISNNFRSHLWLTWLRNRSV